MRGNGIGEKHLLDFDLVGFNERQLCLNPIFDDTPPLKSKLKLKDFTVPSVFTLPTK
ncbi:MAG TPA: hypothetical protein VEL69_01100 [Ktedonobacteraceae bacterium]|nr:hypothetical protein [Ktedonobacteraceae bacterium]